MSERKLYKKKSNKDVVAVQFNLNSDGFTYKKWGATQTCKQGDWLVNNLGDIYTVDSETFKKTYTEISPGVYRKHSVVWAEMATSSGSIKTKEGKTTYNSGDYIVFNDKDDKDVYAISHNKFEDLYELIKNE